MSQSRFVLLLAGLGACVAGAARAQPPAAAVESAEPPVDEDDTIVVTARRVEGRVIGDIPPEVTLSPGDIRSFGVSSLSDLITELAPQTGSGQGRGGESPVVLLNGKRISGFAEVRDIPVEAIQRVEILPEEVALRYGYRANQKVVNVVLRRRFNAVTGELEAGAATGGGRFSPETDNSYLRIADGTRLNLALKYQHSSALYESERDILPQAPRLPYDLVGNVTSAVSGAAVDPGLSALLGRAATVVGVPATAAGRAPTLADFADGVNVADTRRFRTLLPATDALTANGVLARTILGDVSASVNGTLTYNASRSAQGPAEGRFVLPAGGPYSPFAGDTLLYRYLGEAGPLAQRSRDVAGHLGATFNGALGAWQWTLTGSFDHTASRTVTDRGYELSGFQSRLDRFDRLANPYAALPADAFGGRLLDRARSITDAGDAALVLTGPLVTLPAGTATTTIRVGGAATDLRARSVRLGAAASADLSRQSGSGQVSVDLPIASRKKGVLGALGELTANFNAGYDRYSDFGGLRTIGAGLNWTPVTPVTFILSLSEDEGAPTVAQLGGPLVATDGVRVFDYVRGETVDITRVTGGNPALAADDRRVIKLGVTLKPFAATALTVTANYTNSRIDDPIATFPAATAAIEAAFPDRFTRDAGGRLARIDSRPINFARQDQAELRWGVNFSKQLAVPPRPTGGGPDGEARSLRGLLPPGTDGERPDRERRGGGSGPGGGGGGGGGRGPGGFGGGGGGRGTQLQLAVYHTIHLREHILIRDGGPSLDLLDGDAIGSSGGQPRHEVQAQAGLTRNGFGARLSANWQSGTRVDGGIGAGVGGNVSGGVGGGGGSLRFSGLTTAGLRLFANLGQQQALVRRWPLLRGTRVSLSVTNLFDSRLRVRDAQGAVPISYQPDYLDPLGRSVRVSLRKLFF